MKHKNTSCILLIIAGIASLIYSSYATATVFLEQSFSDLVSSSSRIAVVDVVEVRPIHDTNTADGEACGFIYTAKVIEAFKGGSEGFSFVSVSDDDYLEGHSTYLIFAFTHSIEEVAGVLSSAKPPVSDELRDSINCRLTAGTLNVIHSPQTMIPLESSGEHGLVFDSLVVNRSNPFSTLEIETREVERDGKPFGLIDWRTARSLLKRKLEGEDVPLRR